MHRSSMKNTVTSHVKLYINWRSPCRSRCASYLPRLSYAPITFYLIQNRFIYSTVSLNFFLSCLLWLQKFMFRFLQVSACTASLSTSSVNNASLLFFSRSFIAFYGALPMMQVGHFLPRGSLRVLLN